MGHLLFFIFIVAACLLCSAAFTAAAARTERSWLRGVLAAAAVIVPPLGLAPWVAITAGLALLNLETNWLAPTLTALVAAVVGGLWITVAGLSRQPVDGPRVAAAWPVVGLAAMFVMAKAVAFGTLLFIDNAVMAEGRALRVEAAQIMATTVLPAPAAADDAAPLYLRAFAALAADDAIDGEGSPMASPVTVDAASAEVAAILARHAGTLDLVRRAADRPGCRFVRNWSRPSIFMLLPEIQELRGCGRLLALAARRAAAAGDAAAAIRDVVRIHRLGVQAASEPILICGLVGQALDTLALETLAAVLPGLGEEHLPLLDDVALRDFLGSSPDYRAHFLGEEAFGLATLADLAACPTGASTLTGVRALSDVEPLDSILDVPLSLLYRTFLLPADIAGYRAILGRYQAVAGSLAVPSRATYADVRKQVDEIDDTLRRRRAGLFAALMAPTLTSVVEARIKGRARHEAAGVLVAATRARLATGSVPATVDGLVPDRLPAVPSDPFTAAEPLRWKHDDDALVVYSVGPDGEDDGGPVPPGAEKSQANDDVGLRMALPAAAP